MQWLLAEAPSPRRPRSGEVQRATVKELLPPFCLLFRSRNFLPTFCLLFASLTEFLPPYLVVELRVGYYRVMAQSGAPGP